MKAFNPITDTTLSFDAGMTPEYAVAYGHYVESMDMASWFFQTVHDAADQKRAVPRWMEKGGFVYGQRTVSLGDWIAAV